jgi:predicted RNase H-like HicB family nuclease
MKNTVTLCHKIVILLENDKIMTEIIFIVEESLDGGYEARALGESIFTEGDSVDELKQNIREAIHCHFEKNPPKMVRLHYVKEEVFAT